MPSIEDAATIQMILEKIGTLTGRFEKMEENLRGDLSLIHGKIDSMMSKNSCKEIRDRIENDRRDIAMKINGKMDRTTIWHVAGFVGLVVGLVLTALSVVWSFVSK